MTFSFYFLQKLKEIRKFLLRIVNQWRIPTDRPTTKVSDELSENVPYNYLLAANKIVVFVWFSISYYKLEFCDLILFCEILGLREYNAAKYVVRLFVPRLHR